MGTAAIAGFVNTWSPSFYSTKHRIELRNVRQGGNDFLSAVPQAMQAMWAGSVLDRVCEVVQGPLKWIAMMFRIIFHPIICLPLSIVACAIKERFFESSIAVQVPAQTKYYARGPEVELPVRATLSLRVGDQLKHFICGEDVTFVMERSVVIDEGGRQKRFCYRRLNEGEPFDEKCREVDIDGQRVRIRLEWELNDGYRNFVERTIQGQRKYYRLGIEVNEPINGTVSTGEWPPHIYQIGAEIAAETPDCIKIEVPAQTLYYDTGREIGEPNETSKSFEIDGKLRHFSSAKFVSDPTHGLSGWFNKIPKLPFKLPTRLSRFSVQAFEWINRHMSNIIRAVLIASGAALFALGQYYMAAGTVLAVSYEYLNHDLGIVPRKVSIFMEKWMPTISMVGLLIVGSTMSQLMAAASLLMMIPKVNLFIHQKLSKVLRFILMNIKDPIAQRLVGGQAPGDFWTMLKKLEQVPPLEEFDAPLVENKSLNREQIEEILGLNQEALEFNPAHYTKEARPVLNLPENREFSELTRLWDERAGFWTQDAVYERLVTRLADDERFILFLQERFPEAKQFFFEPSWQISREENHRLRNERYAAHRDQILAWVGILAGEKEMSSKQFVADWTRQQLGFFVGKLSGKRAIEGEHQLFAETVVNVAQIIPFLLKPDVDPVQVEDSLVKLAIEGGDYCALAMHRTSKEVLEGFSEPLVQEYLMEADPQVAFEAELRYELQKARHTILQYAYFQTIVQLFRQKEELAKTGQDIHLYAAISRQLKRTFYPLNKLDMEQFDFSDFMFQQTVLLIAQYEMEKGYKEMSAAVMNRIGIDRLNVMRNRTLQYLRRWVRQNESLSNADKHHLLNGALSNDADHLADADNHEKWGRLMLYILGVVRKKRVQPEPEVAREPQRMPQLVRV